MSAQGIAILSQIEGLLQHYLALGDQTPAYASAQEWLSGVRSAMQEASADRSQVDGEQRLGSDGAPTAGLKSFSEARHAALADHKANGGFGKPDTTTSSDQEEEDKKKKRRAKAY